MDSAELRVVILGAGPAGLSAGHVLAARGVSVDVLELKDEVGGLCVTLDRNGFKFDLGGHRWFTKNEELHRWFLDLMKGELVTVQRTSRIYFAGKYFHYPISIKNVLKNAGLVESAHALLSYLVSTVRDLMGTPPPRNMKEAYVAQFGNKLFEMFFRRYSEKVWGTRCEEISADWVAQRSKGLSIVTALKDAVSKRKDVISLIDEFVYPRDGYQRICIRMAEDIVRAGSRVHLGSPVRAIEVHGPRDFTVHFQTGDGQESVRATDVISTIPLSQLVRVTRPAADEETQRAAGSLKFRDLITVTVMLRKPQVTSDTWLYVHDESLLFARIHEPKNWSPAMVPGPEYTSVVCECFCSVDDAIRRLADAEISKRVVDDLATKLRFIRPEEVVDTCVVRTRYTYPVYDLEYRAKLDVIYRFVHAHPGLHIVGRGGTFRYNNADHSVEMGQLLAKTILGDATDHMSVNTEAEYQEEIRRTQANARR